MLQDTELLTAGFPCIDVSRAGQRKGLEGQVRKFPVSSSANADKTPYHDKERTLPIVRQAGKPEMIYCFLISQHREAKCHFFAFLIDIIREIYVKNGSQPDKQNVPNTLPGAVDASGNINCRAQSWSRTFSGSLRHPLPSTGLSLGSSWKM